MANEVHYNNATNKVMRVAANNTVMIATLPTCDNCFPVALDFDFTFSGVVLCAGRAWEGGTNLNATWLFTHSVNDVWVYNDADYDMECNFCLPQGPNPKIARITVLGAVNGKSYFAGADVQCGTTGTATSSNNEAQCIAATVYAKSGSVAWVVA